MAEGRDRGTPLEIDVAIVGAGVAGCYAAARILGAVGPLPEQTAHPRVGLFEASERIGGRLWSHVFEDRKGLPAELGGMRFFQQTPEIATLLDGLGLWDAVTPFDCDRPENLCYLRGARLRRREFDPDSLAARPEALPYRLRPGERGLAPDELVWLAVAAAFPDLPDVHREFHASGARGDRSAQAAYAMEYRSIKSRPRPSGVALVDRTWTAFLQNFLSSEALAFIQDAGGYEIMSCTGSAAGWLDNVFFTSPRVPHQQMACGLESLASTLHERYARAGGGTFLGHRLLRVGRHDGTRYRLVFSDRAGDRRCVTAGTVVLALPKPALEALEERASGLGNGTVRRGMAAVRAVPALKLFLDYTEPWWEQAGVSAGRSTTDLPIRQCYYLSGRGRHLLMGAYVCGRDTDYWSRLGDNDGNSAGAPSQAPRSMVARAHEQLLELHGVVDAPFPKSGFYQDWSKPPHGAGWHVWDVGAHPEDTASAMLRPAPAERVFIAGACWSDEPGSVQGALRTVDAIFKRHGDTLRSPWPSTRESETEQRPW